MYLKRGARKGREGVGGVEMSPPDLHDVTFSVVAITCNCSTRVTDPPGCNQQYNLFHWTACRPVLLAFAKVHSQGGQAAMVACSKYA